MAAAGPAGPLACVAGAAAEPAGGFATASGAGRSAAAWRAWGMAGAGMLVAGLLLAAWTPPDSAAWTTCAFRRLTGLECATCGMTRALSALAHGDLAGSLARHPLAAPLAAEAALLWLLAPLALHRGWRPRPAWTRAWAWGHGAALLVAWGARLAR